MTGAAAWLAAVDGRPRHDPLPDVERIAVVRANALGDLVFALPALDALRRTYPEAEITLLGTELHRALLADRPSPVDRVVPVPPGAGLPEVPGPPLGPAEVDAFFDGQRAEGYDLALQLHGGGGNSNPVTLRLGARVTAGLRAPGAAPLDREVPFRYWQHEVARYLEVVALVGAAPVLLEPAFAVTAGDRSALADVLPAAGPVAVLHPGATDPRRRWPAASFAAVGDRLAEAGPAVVVTGTEAEAELVAEVVDRMRHPARGLAGQLGLGALAALLERAGVLVSNDTGPLHLAGAVGGRSVGIYWCGNLLNGGHAGRSRHRPLASWRLGCPACGRSMLEGCEDGVSFVADVPVDEVAAEALDLLGDAGRHG